MTSAFYEFINIVSADKNSDVMLAQNEMLTKLLNVNIIHTRRRNTP
jgi:hypothetical protein